jgi:hypothetical protein
VAGETEHIGALLLEEGLLTRRDLDRAVEVQTSTGTPLTRVLVTEGIVEEADLVRALARHIGLEYVNLSEVNVDPVAAALLPESLARRYMVIPIGFEDDRLVVAMADPGNVLVIDDVRAVTGHPVLPRIATRSDIEDAIRREPLRRPVDLAGWWRRREGRCQLRRRRRRPHGQLVAPDHPGGQRNASDIPSSRGADLGAVPYRRRAPEVMTTPGGGSRWYRLKIMPTWTSPAPSQDGRVGCGWREAFDLRVAACRPSTGEGGIRILDKDDAILSSPTWALPHALEIQSSYRSPTGRPGHRPDGLGKDHHPVRRSRAQQPQKNIITVRTPSSTACPASPRCR